MRISFAAGPLFALALGFASAAVAAEGKLVLYTSQPNTDAQQTVDAFTAKNPGVKVEWVRDGTPKILAKLRAEIEAGQPQADVLLIADVVTMEGLKKEGRLLAYPQADLAAFDPAIMDKDRTWFSTKLITTGIVYNTKAPIVPKSWRDLARPEAKGLIAMPSPLASGAALIHTVSLVENLPGGWDYFTALGANGAQATGGNGDVLKAVAGGDKLYGMVVDFMAIREKAKGAPVAFVFPAEGVSAVTEPVAILKTARNPDAARAFVDFVLSPEGQTLEVGQGYIPARADVALPAGYPPRSEIKILAFDAAKALAEEKANKEKFSDAMSR
ncbi:extracellular solute-binding protein [Siculibacillus lacustris]|uniref:Extracellular solute-binding protein n=1 Tax=Siculibacillus lacustris TaxID=1549641 RepID=A0A4V2KUB7_9HYPH|nr:ABC transporter substrate-binding protein [Siculibacillus lacustris]TBW40846.1 extracellular solute-binding protein [Siculibacillus lacustris]